MPYPLLFYPFLFLLLSFYGFNTKSKNDSKKINLTNKTFQTGLTKKRSNLNLYSAYPVYKDSIRRISFNNKTLIFTNDTTLSTENNRIFYSKILRIGNKYRLYYESRGIHEEGCRINRNLNVLESNSPFGPWQRLGTVKTISPNCEKGVHGFDIVKINDSLYPFRLYYNAQNKKGVKRLYQAKSRDGLNFEKDKIINEYRDNQVSAIPINNGVKLFLRKWPKNYTTRKLSVKEFDLEGNVVKDDIILDLENVYTSSVQVLNEKENLLLPTFFVNDNHPINLKAYLLKVDSNKISELKTVNTNLMVEDSMNMGTISPGLIRYQGKNYVLWTDSGIQHGTGNSNSKYITHIYLVEMQIDRF